MSTWRFRRLCGDLVAEVAGGERVSTPGDLVGCEQPRRDVGVVEPAARVGGVAAVEGEIAALGADDDLVAPELAGGDEGRERASDHAFAPLSAVVGGRVDEVRAETERGRERLGVGGVGRVVGIAEVRAEPERRDGQRVEAGPEMGGGKEIGVPLTEAAGSVRTRGPRHHAPPSESSGCG